MFYKYQKREYKQLKQINKWLTPNLNLGEENVRRRTNKYFNTSTN